MSVADFGRDLAYSHSQADAAWWPEVYRKAFGEGCTLMDTRADGWAQRAGIDRTVHTADGRLIRIDEKVRRTEYGDIVLEHWSNWERQVPGWVCKPCASDYIAYAIVPSRRCYLFPVPALQRAWRRNGDAWIRTFGERESQNRGYRTRWVAIPTRQLMDAIRDALIVSWGG